MLNVLGKCYGIEKCNVFGKCYVIGKCYATGNENDRFRKLNLDGNHNLLLKGQCHLI